MAELKQRKTTNLEGKDTTEADASGRNIDAGLEMAAAYVPENVAVHLRKAGPVLKSIVAFFNAIAPYLVKIYDFALLMWAKLQPYHPEEFAPALLGLIVAFFGGHFMTTIAAVEAFRLSGYERTKTCLLDLYDDYKKVEEANKKDDLVDDDNDGVADVAQISTQELARRKMRLILITCDPVKVSNALAGVYSGLFGVVATLKVQFARAITLGCSIGDFLYKICLNSLKPVLLRVTPAEYQKWIDPVMSYGCKSAGVAFAWTIQRFISAFHSAMRGGDLFARGLGRYLHRNGVDSTLTPGSFAFNMVALATGAAGFYWQASSFFNLSFPFNILLLPLRIVEWWLMYLVGVEA